MHRISTLRCNTGNIKRNKQPQKKPRTTLAVLLMLFGTFPVLEYLVSTLQCLSLRGPGKEQLQRNRRHLELLLPNSDSHYQIHQNTADPGMCLCSIQGNCVRKMTQYPTPGAVTKVEAYQTPNTRCVFCLNL